MKYRLYGIAPYCAVAVHGGPGAPGGVSTLAKGLSKTIGVIEPFQTENTIMGQVDELYSQICEITDLPVHVLGHSWGAWISYLFTHKYPNKVKKVFLIGSGAFHAKYVKEMNDRRMSHFTESERKEYKRIIQELNSSISSNKDMLLKRLGELADKSDNYFVEDTPDNVEEMVKIDGDQFKSVWQEGAKLRENGFFIQIATSIQRPIRVIHGSDDPTPIEGVIDPIKDLVSDMKWYKLDRCGHNPWKEKYCQSEFWQIVWNEIENCT